MFERETIRARPRIVVRNYSFATKPWDSCRIIAAAIEQDDVLYETGFCPFFEQCPPDPGNP